MSDSPINILITGVAGFIASNVAIHLVNKYPQYSFVGIDKLSYCSSINNIKPIKDKDNFKFVKADITDIDFMNFIFEQYDINIVLHFAAYSHVDHSFANSITFTHNNVLGTHVILEVSKVRKIKRFIHVSTDEVYGNQSHSQSNENTILDPTNPYAATKAAAEHLVRSYYHSFGLPIIITRGNNVYGPRQYPEKVIPKFILRLSRGLKCLIHGSGDQKRSFLYIDDVSNAFDIVLHHGIVGEIYNIGCSDEYSIRAIAKNIIKILKPNEKYEDWIVHVEDRDFNDQRYYISTDKIEALGWKRKIPFNQGLSKTIQWYLKNNDYWDTDELLVTLNK